MKKAFTLIELLIVVAIIAILAAIAVPNFLEAQVRSKVSRVKSDQRSFATALESYYIDNNTYPPFWSQTSGVAANATLGISAHNSNDNVNGIRASTGDQPNARKTPTFGFNANGVRGALTTPVSFMTSYASDVFAEVKTNTFGYVYAVNQWILTSPGPSATDNVPALFPGGGNTADLTRIFLNGTQAVTLPSNTLISGYQGTRAYTYDPTNGTSSTGDVWKLKG